MDCFTLHKLLSTSKLFERYDLQSILCTFWESVAFVREDLVTGSHWGLGCTPPFKINGSQLDKRYTIFTNLLTGHSFSGAQDGYTHKFAESINISKELDLS